jgi:hypothetical protein
MDAAALAAIGKAQRIYTWPTFTILACFLTYLCTLVLAATVAWFFPLGSLRVLVVGLVPLLTLVLNVFITCSVYRASDEYIRLRILKCAAFTGVILMFGTLGYFCLEQFGYPRLSMIVVNVVGWSFFNLLLIGVRFRAR